MGRRMRNGVLRGWQLENCTLSRSRKEAEDNEDSERR